MYKFNPELDLKLELVLDASCEKLFKAWTDANHIKPWFCPAPWKVTEAEIDLRPGGKFNTTMEGPNGEKFPNNGCLLEIVPNRKLVWTSVMGENFRPMPPGHVDMTGVLL
ncbi:MAG: SRPBCC domain-containing protein, partial [Flavisolibacter sp.]